MESDGRIDERAQVNMPVHILAGESGFFAQTAIIVNISRRGARILTHRRWRQGEQLGLTSLSGEFRLQGRVIYCYRLTEKQFCAGLEFAASSKNWKDPPWADVA